MRAREAYLQGKLAALSLAGAKGGNDADRLARALSGCEEEHPQRDRKGRMHSPRGTGDPMPWGPRTSPEGISGHIPMQLGNADGQYGGTF